MVDDATQEIADPQDGFSNPFLRRRYLLYRPLAIQLLCMPRLRHAALAYYVRGVADAEAWLHVVHDISPEASFSYAIYCVHEFVLPS